MVDNAPAGLEHILPVLVFVCFCGILYLCSPQYLCRRRLQNADEEKQKREKLACERLEFRRIVPFPSKQQEEKKAAVATVELDLEEATVQDSSSSSDETEGIDIEAGEADESIEVDNAVEISGAAPPSSAFPSNVVAPPSSAFSSVRAWVNDDSSNVSEHALPVSDPQDKNSDKEDGTIYCIPIPSTSAKKGIIRSFLSRDTPPSITVFSSNEGSKRPDQECCSICLEPYEVGDVVAGMKSKHKKTTSKQKKEQRCKHWFHKECILEWLQDHDECPLCRVEMIE
jgi:hypothetical protein